MPQGLKSIKVAIKWPFEFLKHCVLKLALSYNILGAMKIIHEGEMLNLGTVSQILHNLDMLYSD